MAWDEKAEELLGTEITNVLDNNDISVVSIEKTDEGLAVEMEFYSDAGEDFIIDLECESREDFAEAFEKYARDFDPNGHAEMWVEAKNDVRGVPQDISTLIDDANSIKELLEEVSAELSGKDYVREKITVQLTLDREELEKLAAIAGVDADALDKEETASLLHEVIYQADTPVPAIPEQTVSEEQVIEWGKKQLSDLTDGNMWITIEPVDYKDFMSSDTVLKSFNEYRDLVASGKDSGVTFSDYLREELEHLLWEASTDAENDLVMKIAERAAKESPEFQQAYDRFTGNKDFAELDFTELDKFGYEGTSISLEDYLNHDYHINLMLATQQERNYDMSSITSTFPLLTDVSDGFLNDAKELDNVADNALTYLIHQQGHTIDEVYQSLYEGKHLDTLMSGRDFKPSAENDDFVNSVAAEIDNNYYGGMAEVTLLVTAKGEDLINLLDNIAHGRDYISCSKDTEIGLYNEWSGAGSDFEIALEQPVVFPAGMVRNVQFERSEHDDYVNSERNDGYTVDEVYGLIGSVWEKSSVSLTAEAPVLMEENTHNAHEALKNYAKAEKEASNSKVNIDLD